ATASYRNGPRKQILNGGTYLRPTIVHCDSFEHPLANREFLFPYASVVEVPQREMLTKIGHSLVVTAITERGSFIEKLLHSSSVPIILKCSANWCANMAARGCCW